MKIQMRIFLVTALLPAGFMMLSPGNAAGGAAPGVDIEKFVTTENYPDYDAVVLLNSCRHDFEVYLELHTSTQRQIATRTRIEREKKIKILRESGFDRYGNFKSPFYYRETHNYKIEACVISPEGKKRNISRENIKRIDVAGKYFRYMVAFPGLEIGSIIEIKETVESDYPILSGFWNFAEEVPTLRSQMIFRVPKETNALFNFVPKDAMKKPEPTQQGKNDVYMVTLENVPPYVDEMYMSPDNIGNPTIYYHVWMISNNDLAAALGVEPQQIEGRPYTMNWKDVAEVFGAYFDHETWKDFEGSDEYRKIMGKDIEQFRSGFDITEEKFDELLSWFHSEFEAVDDDLFYFWSNPEESFKLRKGGPWELAYTLKYILNEICVPTEVVLVRDADKGLLNRNMPSYTAFTHPLLKVEMMGREIWLDPFSHFCGANQIPWRCRGDQAMRLLNNRAGNFTQVYLAGADKNCFANSHEAALGPDGTVTGTTKIALSGQHLLELRRSVDEDDPGKFEESLKTKLKETFPETFDRESLEIMENGRNELKARFAYSIPAFADTAGGYMNIDLTMWHSTSMTRLFSAEKRKYDILFPFLEMETSRVNFVLPEGISIEALPEPGEISCDFFSYSRSVKANGNTIEFERVFKIINPKIEAKDYLAAREFVNRVHDLDSEELIIKY